MPNPELVALLTCDATAADPSGKTTLYGVFDLIWAQQYPVVHPQLSIFCKCFFSAAGEARLSIERPDGGSLLALEPPIRAEAPGAVQAIYTIAGLQFPSEGEYKIRLAGPTGQLGATRLDVRTRQ